MIWLPSVRFGIVDRDLCVRVEADLALHERVAVDLQAVGVAEERLLAEAEQPAGVVAPLDDHVGGLLREHVPELAVVKTAWSAAILTPTERRTCARPSTSPAGVGCSTQSRS